MAENESAISAEQEIRDTVIADREQSSSRSTSQSNSYSDSFVGSSFLNFKIISPLGRGAMGTVYRARHTILNKDAAIKLLHPHLCTDENAIKRFKQEATSASRLQHPGIVGVQDFGVTAEGRPYLVMDYVEGKNLSQLIAQGPMEPQRALKLCSQICTALEEAHSKGVIHRDIKPSNVIVINEGQPNESIKVVDFGIAKVIAENQPVALTQTGESIGSPPYMSPEQCQALLLDARSDIYSLGCVLYEMLAGVSPFASNSIYETIHKQITAIPDPLRKARPQLRNAVELDAIVLTALAKDRDRRFQTIEQFKTQIDAVLTGESNKGWKGAHSAWVVFSARHRLSKLAITASLVILSAIPCYLVMQWLGQQPTPALRTSASAPGAANSDSADNFYRSKRDAESYLQARNFQEALTAYRRALKLGETRGDEDRDYQDCLRGLQKCLYKTGSVEEANATGRTLKTLALFDHDRLDVSANASLITELSNQHINKPNDKTITRNLIQALTQQGSLYASLAKLPESAECANTAWQLAKQAHLETEEQPIRALALSASRDVLRRDYKSAERKQNELLKLCRAAHVPAMSPQMAALNAVSSDYYFRYATDTEASKKLTESQIKEYKMRSKSCFQSLISIDRELYGRSSPYLADAMRNYATALRHLGQWTESRALFDQAVEMNRKYRGANDIRLANALYGLGYTQLKIAKQHNNDAFRIRQAIETLTEAKEILEHNKTGGGESVLWATYANLGDAYCKLNNLAEAEKWLNLSFEQSRKEKPLTDTPVFACHRLMDIYKKQNRTNDLETLQRNLADLSAPKKQGESEFQ